MRRRVRGILSRTLRAAFVPVVTVLVASFALPGCEVERVKFSRLDEGKKFLAAGDPFQAAVYFQEALIKEKEQKSESEAHLVVACDRAAHEAAGIASERGKYELLRRTHLAVVREDQTALSHLAAILGYHDLSSQSARGLLVELGAASVPALLDAYEHKPEERETVLRVLAEIGVPAVPAVREAIRADALVADEQAALVRLIGDMGSPETEGFLREMRQDAATPGVQAEAAAALYRLGDKSERDFLVKELGSDSLLARRAAATAMSFIQEKPSQDVIIGHLGDSDVSVRLALVRALGGYAGTPEAIHALITIIRNEATTDVANAAVDSLSRLGPAVIGPILDAFAIESEWPAQQRLVRALSSEGVRVGFNQDLEYRLYQLYEKRAAHPQVKGDMARLLQQLEGK